MPRAPNSLRGQSSALSTERSSLPPTSPPSALPLVIGFAWSSAGYVVVAEVTAGPTLLPTRLSITLMPAFHDDNDDKDNSFRRPSPWRTIVSDPGSACKIDARTVLNVGVMAPLTSTSLPALPRFDTNVRAPTSNVLERTQRPSRYPPSSPITPPPSLPSMAIFSTTLPTLPTSLNSTPSTPSIAPSPPCFRAHPTSATTGSPLDDVADAFNVALLDELDAAVALYNASRAANPLVGDDEIARRQRRDSTSETTARRALALLSGVGNVGRYWLYRPPTSRSNASCSLEKGGWSRAWGLLRRGIAD
ncbi:hypothetical protein EV715DRAFT_298066 [Schizophyllum commune]